MSVSAKVVADSKFRETRLITLEIELHRFVLPEFNTHRSLSRNFQSSRAVPIEKMIEQVRTNPAMPVYYGKNQSGMQAKEELHEAARWLAQDTWVYAAKNAAIQAEHLLETGLHKQLVNRVLEPFMWTKGVVTATEFGWEAFFKLRMHKDAQPEIAELADKIYGSIVNSQPTQLDPGDWHMPYFGGEGVGYWLQGCGINLKDAIRISASCAAQVSYRKLDDSLEKARKVYDMLNLPTNGVYPEDPPHFSPTEHIAKAWDKSLNVMSGNFQSGDFVQYRKVLEFGLEQEVIGGSK